MGSDVVELAGLILAAAAIGAALVGAVPAAAGPGAAPSAFARFAADPWRSVLAAALVPLVLRVALLPWLGVPVPTIHDEFSLLLQADTLLSGRLANPPHPYWEHFESFHILQQPTYGSVYFPLRGAPLVLGQALGHPWIGVLMVFAALCAAVTWALRGLTTPSLALVGGLLVGLRYGLFSYWINSYWGGSITALGGALVLGAYLRVRPRARWRDGAMLGAGVVLLMTTRPLEGFFFCLPFACALAVWLVGRIRARDLGAGLRVAVPSLAALAAGMSFMLAFDAAATGDVLKTPYGVNRHQYAVAPAFLVTDPIAGERRGDASMRRFYDWEAVAHHRRDSAEGVVKAMGRKLINLYSFYIGAALALPFLVGAAVLARRHPVPAAAGGLVAASFFAATWDFAHYASPAFVLFAAATVLGLGRLGAGPAPGRRGAFLARALPLAAILPLVLPAAAVLAEGPGRGSVEIGRPCCANGRGPGSARPAVEAALERTPGRDLVFVDTQIGDNLHFTWIVNRADIDAAEIVWARDLGPERNRPLIADMADRHVWYGTEGGLLRGEPPAERPAP